MRDYLALVLSLSPLMAIVVAAVAFVAGWPLLGFYAVAALVGLMIGSKGNPFGLLIDIWMHGIHNDR